MGAIAVHHTEVDTESSWDGPAEVAKAPNESDVLEYMHTWVNDDGDEDAKASYKLPHHAAGEDTPANLKGINNALARLSQTNIPESDKAGVEKHLRAHRTDAGLENRMNEKEIFEAVDHVAKVDDLDTKEKRALRSAIRAQEEAASVTHAAEVGEGAMPVPLRSPIRCFDGNAKPYEPFWNLVNAAQAESGEPEIEMYGPISEFMWAGDEVTPKLFKDDLYKLGNKGPVTVRLNSPGGDVIAASVIRSIMLDYPGKITVKVDGMAASAAVMVALGGDVVKMHQSAYMFVHDPMVMFFMAALNISDLAGLLSELKTVKAGIIEAYAQKTKLTNEKLSKLMTDETWMTASDAVSYGFADEIITPAAGQTGGMNVMNYVNVLQKHYVHIPQALLDRSRAEEQERVANVELEREAQSLRDEIRKYL